AEAGGGGAVIGLFLDGAVQRGGDALRGDRQAGGGVVIGDRVIGEAGADGCRRGDGPGRAAAHIVIARGAGGGVGRERHRGDAVAGHQPGLGEAGGAIEAHAAVRAADIAGGDGQRRRVDLAVGIGERGGGQVVIPGVVATQSQAGVGDGLAAAHIGVVVIAGGGERHLVAADQRRQRVIRAEAGGGGAVIGLFLDGAVQRGGDALRGDRQAGGGVVIGDRVIGEAGADGCRRGDGPRRAAAHIVIARGAGGGVGRERHRGDAVAGHQPGLAESGGAIEAHAAVRAADIAGGDGQRRRVDLAVGIGERGGGQVVIPGVVAAQGQAGVGDGLAAAHIGRVVIAGGAQGDLVAADQRRQRVIRAEAGGGGAVVGLLLDGAVERGGDVLRGDRQARLSSLCSFRTLYFTPES